MYPPLRLVKTWQITHSLEFPSTHYFLLPRVAYMVGPSWVGAHILYFSWGTWSSMECWGTCVSQPTPASFCSGLQRLYLCVCVCISKRLASCKSGRMGRYKEGQRVFRRDRKGGRCSSSAFRRFSWAKYQTYFKKQSQPGSFSSGKIYTRIHD